MCTPVHSAPIGNCTILHSPRCISIHATLHCTALHWTMLNYFELHFTAMQHSSLSSHLFLCHSGALHIVMCSGRMDFQCPFAFFRRNSPCPNVLYSVQTHLDCPDAFPVLCCIESRCIYTQLSELPNYEEHPDV